MQREKNNPIVLYVTIILLLIGGTVGMSLKVSALSPTLVIQIDQQIPFFSPRTLAAVEGAVIQWENRTGEAHTILSDDCLRRGKCSFESRRIEPGGNFVVTNLQPGDYAYHCGIHPFMRGLLTVRNKSPRVQSADI